MKQRTEELLQMFEKNLNIVEFIKNNNEEFEAMTLPECLSSFLLKYDVKKSEVINKSGLNHIYAYQIFAGTKTPSRDKLIALMFGYMLSTDDGNMLLKSAGYSGLYPRDKRDAVVIFGLNNKLKISEVDDMLFELNEETIIK